MLSAELITSHAFFEVRADKSFYLVTAGVKELLHKICMAKALSGRFKNFIREAFEEYVGRSAALPFARNDDSFA